MAKLNSYSIKEMVDNHLLFTIEKGLNDGYIATIGDISSDEQPTIYLAVRQATWRNNTDYRITA